MSDNVCCPCHLSVGVLTKPIPTNNFVRSICDACNAQHAVEKELADAHAVTTGNPETLSRLESRRLDLCSSVNERHDPFEKLSRELRLKIFKLLAKPSYPIRAGAFTLGLVCKAWRNFTLSEPSLWKSVTFTFDLDSRDDINEGRQIASSLLGRSQQAKVRIGISTPKWREVVRPEQYMNRTAELQRVLHTICLESHRFADLNFAGPSLMRSYLLDVLSSSQLRWLGLSSPGSYGPQQPYPNLDGKRWNSPNITYRDYDREMLEEPIRWENLTVLDAHFHSLVEYLEVLRMAPNLWLLRMLDQNANISLERLEEYSRPVRHEKLTVLEMKWSKLVAERPPEGNISAKDLMTAFFSNATLPSLDELTIQMVPQGPVDMHGDHTNGLSEFLERSKCKLETLRLLNWSHQKARIEDLLCLIPTLETFELRDQDPDTVNHFLRSLDQRQTRYKACGESYLPNLKNVDIVLKSTTGVREENTLRVFPPLCDEDEDVDEDEDEDEDEEEDEDEDEDADEDADEIMREHDEGPKHYRPLSTLAFTRLLTFQWQETDLRLYYRMLPLRVTRECLRLARRGYGLSIAYELDSEDQAFEENDRIDLIQKAVLFWESKGYALNRGRSLVRSPEGRDVI